MKGLRIKDVAERVGVSIGLISKYENDKVLPSLWVMHKLANVLGCNISTFFDDNWVNGAYVARSGERPLLGVGGRADPDGVVLESLTPSRAGLLLQGNIHIVSPGGGSMGAIAHEGDEAGFILEGSIELTLDEVVYKLSCGDSFAFSSKIPHAYHNVSSSTCRILWFNTPPTF